MNLISRKTLVFSAALLAATVSVIAPHPAFAQGVVLQAESAPVAPNFAVHGLNGDSAQLSSYRGRPVLLVVWASWCPASRHMMPIINELHRRYSARGLVILAVSDEEASVQAKYGRDHHLAVPMARPGAGMEEYETGSVPTSILISAQGKLIFLQEGVSDETQPILAALVEEELPGKVNNTAAKKGAVKKPGAKTAKSPIKITGKPVAKPGTKAVVEPSAAQRALAQSRAKVPASAKSNGIFILGDDGIKAAH